MSEHTSGPAMPGSRRTPDELRALSAAAADTLRATLRVRGLDVDPTPEDLATLGAGYRALALETLDAAMWAARVRDRLGWSAAALGVARDVKRLVQTARAAIGACPPCLACDFTRGALVDRVTQRVAAYLAAHRAVRAATDHASVASAAGAVGRGPHPDSSSPATAGAP